MSSRFISSLSHALIRLCTFLILIIFLALGNTSTLIFIGCLCLALYWLDPPADVQQIKRNIIRLKWLYLSIILVYLFSNSSADQGYLLTFWLGFERILILIVILALLGWLMQKTSREALISALINLLSPFRFIGFPVYKLALRIELVLREVDDIRQRLINQVSGFSLKHFDVKKVAVMLAELFQEIESYADNRSLDTIQLNLSDKPVWIAWALPIGLFFLLLVINAI